MKVVLAAINASFMHANLALRQLMAANAGRECELYEGHINLTHRKVLEAIARKEPDVVAFSCYIWNVRYIMRLACALKAALPGLVIILGGPEVSHCAEQMLKAHPEIDHIISGEGERALAELLTDIENGETARSVRYGAPVSYWPDCYEAGISGLEDRIIYIETSRGCPYNCSYCLSSATGSVRALPSGESVKRLTHLADMGAQLIKLVDRTFNFDKARANEIWRGLICHAVASGYLGTYHFEIGAHLIDSAALEVISSANLGLFQFEVGLQSSDPAVLTAVERRVRYEDVTAGTRGLLAIGNAHVHVDLIAGMPGDNMEKFRKSFNDAYALGADMLQLGFLKLLHGSGLRRDAAALGLIFEPDAPYEILSTPDMTFGELMALKDVETVLDWYVNSGRYSCAMRFLVEQRAPFDVLMELALKFRREGVLNVERGEKARATALIEANDSGQLRALVRHDMLLSRRRRDLPDVLAFSEDAGERALLRARFHPVRGQSAFRYEYDVERYEAGGPLEMCETLVIYE